MADLLSSGALLATVLSLFYTLWYPEIKSALDTYQWKDKVEDSKEDIDALEGIIRRRVLPLLVASLAVLLALVPDALRSMAHSWSAFHSAKWTYDGVATLYMLMVAMMTALVIHVGGLYADCRKRFKLISHADES
jgi:hypothetical protein